MSKCSVAVTVDGWQADDDVAPTFQVGQTVGGTVDVWVTEAARCDGLDVRLELRPTQKGYALPKGPAPVRLFAGEWQPGEYKYRFELPSTFPPTYEGTFVGWAWVALATVDIPWAADPKGDAAFVLEAPAATGELSVQPPGPDNVEAGATSEGYQALVSSATMFAAALVALTAGVVLHLLELASDDVSGGIAGIATMGSIGSGIWLIIAGWAYLKSGRRWRASVKLTPPGPQADYRSSAAQRKMMHCEVQTRGGGAIERVVAHVLVREFVRWQERSAAGDSSTTREYEKVHVRVEVPLEGDAAAGIWSGGLPFPELGPEVPPYTLFDDEGRGLLWQVDVHSYRRGSAKPDVESRYLTVRSQPAT